MYKFVILCHIYWTDYYNRVIRFSIDARCSLLQPKYHQLFLKISVCLTSKIPFTVRPSFHIENCGAMIVESKKVKCYWKWNVIVCPLILQVWCLVVRCLLSTSKYHAGVIVEDNSHLPDRCLGTVRTMIEMIRVQQSISPISHDLRSERRTHPSDPVITEKNGDGWQCFLPRKIRAVEVPVPVLQLRQYISEQESLVSWILLHLPAITWSDLRSRFVRRKHRYLALLFYNH